MERLGLGPDAAQALNPRLVYGRVTGWGQEGPLAQTAGHDINYLALTGALHAIGPSERPVPPLNLVADFGGGALYLAMGIIAALYERDRSGQGQVVDSAMVDGASSLMAMTYGLFAAGKWRDERESNLLDGGAPWYRTYRCADGGYVALGALERKFFIELMAVLGIEAERFPDHLDPSCWPALEMILSDVLARKPRDEWCALVGDRDACLTPVLSLQEAPRHPQMRARSCLVSAMGVTQPGIAPRFSRTPGSISTPALDRKASGEDLLSRWGAERRRPRR
jgi:alpha-methylacyl-CoA racemase